MGDDLFGILGIPKKAIEMIVSINFLLPDHEKEKRILFIDENRGLDLKTINRNLLNLRRKIYKNLNTDTSLTL